MILQALNDYYERKKADPDSGIPPYGFEWKEIPFVILLSRTGEFIQLDDTRTPNGKKMVGFSYLVPKSKTRPGTKSYEKPNILWDHYGFVLGTARQENTDFSPKARDIETADKQNQKFMQQVAYLASLYPDDHELQLVKNFYSDKSYAEVFNSPNWQECIKIPGCNLSFRIQGSDHLVCQSDGIRHYIEKEGQNSDAHQSICLVTGERTQIARLHPEISGVAKKPAPFAAVNDGVSPAFSSFGKSQGYNFPVGDQAVFAYTTALNHLLQRDSRQRLQVGDASTVFWADKQNPLETDFIEIFGEPAKGDDPDRNAQKVRALYKAVESGGYTPDDDKNLFYVLGLAPNAARIAVRFWQVATVSQLSLRIVRHFNDLKIVHHPKEPPYPSLFRLLVHTAAQGKADNIPPNLGGELMRAVLGGGLYPQTLLQAAVRRNRAERNIDYYRAALIKAVLNRQNRIHHHIEKEITVALDPDNTHTGYRLGRLFAVLEKIQQEAQGDINATIRDKFYGAASSSPLSVFSNLMKLKNHHLSKLDRPGRANWFEKLIGEILDGVKTFPAQMPLPEQGLFAIGYYHQRQDFFKPKQTEETGE